MRTFTTGLKFFLILSFCLAVTYSENDVEFEIVEVELDEEPTGPTAGNTDATIVVTEDYTDGYTGPTDGVTDTTDGASETTEGVTEPKSGTTEPTDGGTSSTPNTIIVTTTPFVTSEAPAWEDYQTRINIFDKTAEEFASENEARFKESVARYASLYCNETGEALCIVDQPEATTPQDPEPGSTEPGSEATTPDNSDDSNAEIYNFVKYTNQDGTNIAPEDVAIDRRLQVGNDLQIGLFIELANNVLLQREVLDTVMEVYGANIAEDSGIRFELIGGGPGETTSSPLIPTTEVGAEPPTPDGGLAGWEIALIVIGSLAGVAIIGGLVYYFLFKKDSTSFRELDYESTSRRLTDPERPAHTYESLSKNRQSLAPDSANGGTTTFNNATFDNTTYDNMAFDKNETDNMRSENSTSSIVTIDGKAWSATPYTRL